MCKLPLSPPPKRLFIFRKVYQHIHSRLLSRTLTINTCILFFFPVGYRQAGGPDRAQMHNPRYDGGGTKGIPCVDDTLTRGDGSW